MTRLAHRIHLFLQLLLSFFLAAQASAQTDTAFIRQIFDSALVAGRSHQDLYGLCKKAGPRLSGSYSAEVAVDYTKKLMESYGFDTVFLQPVMVPKWVRGTKERGIVMAGGKTYPMAICALGGSVAPEGGKLVAPIIEVKGFGQLDSLGEAAIKGKIVFFNQPFDNRFIGTFSAYGVAGKQRWGGAIAAARYGAVGVLVRSMTSRLDDYPHTGSMAYDSAVRKIPGAAVSTIAAENISKILKEQREVEFSLEMNCQMEVEVLSYNVIGQINGAGKSDRFIVVGGHLDSWDLGEGAHDDGAGCIQSIEALRLLKINGYKPSHTLRAVMFMNEENGLRGGIKYAELAEKNAERHVYAIESDRGGFTPRGFSFDVRSQAELDYFRKWKGLFAPYLCDDFSLGGGGADIGPLKKSGTTCIGFVPDSQRYFDFHHAASDVWENVNKRELELGAAAISSLLFLLDKYGD